MLVGSLGSSQKVLRTLEVVHPCTGNRSYFLYKTDMVELRHTSAFGFGSGCMPVWRGPACAVLAGQQYLRNGPYKGLVRMRPGHIG
jgi:hypothetical protein